MIKRVLYVLLILVLIGLAGYTLSMINFDQRKADQAQIIVQYRAEGEFNPDLAIIVLGVESYGKDLALVYQDNNDKMNRLVGVLQGMEGIEVETLNFQVMPINRREEDEALTEYRVVNQLEVKTDNLQELSLIMQKAISSGANQVLSIKYLLQDLKDAKEVVISRAFEGLKDKMDFIANRLDGQRYKIVAMEINDQYLASNFYNYRQDYGQAGVMLENSTLPPISAHKIKVVVNIKATYSLSDSK